ncbi:MAG: DUF2023 family protein [Rikenellaceae bacterium]|jgi:hypothetical protein|nr:DUF2023 family protein [Rikenellaceae bacterium]
MRPEIYSSMGEMRVVMHMIYEFRKGIRALALCTLCPTCAGIVKQRLDSQNISYIEQPVAANGNVNLFFGSQVCLEAISAFIDKPLNMLTPEEDFMLGTMLGYDLRQQCRRFCNRKRSVKQSTN